MRPVRQYQARLFATTHRSFLNDSIHGHRNVAVICRYLEPPVMKLAKYGLPLRDGAHDMIVSIAHIADQYTAFSQNEFAIMEEFMRMQSGGRAVCRYRNA